MFLCLIFLKIYISIGCHFDRWSWMKMIRERNEGTYMSGEFILQDKIFDLISYFNSS